MNPKNYNSNSNCNCNGGNQYQNKYEQNNNGNLKQPYFVSTVSSGYTQTEECVYFKGKGNEVSFTYDEPVYYILVNPENSGVDLVVNMSVPVNLSNVPVRADTFYCVKNSQLKVKMCECNNEIVTNTNCYGKKPIGQVYTACNLNINCESSYVYTVLPYDNYRGTPNGSTIISPGYAHVTKLTPIITYQNSMAVMSYAWWEKPRNNCK